MLCAMEFQDSLLAGSAVRSPVPFLIRIAFCVLLTVFLIADGSTKARAESSTAASQPSAPMKIEALGKGAVPLDGAWQFHAGDDLSWARPEIDDLTGHDGWEQLKADAPWGTQSHPN